ncbi:TIGR00375 family protein [Methanobrevibacter sp. TMH8]|uniref:TIGR00375 family protein n=1 Tax=Methanobrevibacter sp. TMH8 TaxID=2848611 RepID=UPI001CCFCB0C|nr:TIGR00375 family protein [Methanobrevibacter sp. TMH8]MBZ9570975.1 TIGR00375 family protein [Methanobrevibacter sp. TMH8]
MIVNADLHVHSCFSMASSKDMVIDNIAPQAKLKGLQLMGTGDALHPGWLDIIENSTEYIGDGVYSTNDCDFVLTTEIEGEKKIHHLIFIPTIEIAREIGDKLVSTNKYKDGRPRTKMNGIEIMDLVKEYDCLIGPAHAFTPWTGMYKTFDSIYDCYGQKPDFLELGLSADTDMADTIKELQDIPFLSNSDAHSPWPHRLGREFNQIELQDISFSSLKSSIKNNKIKANYGLVANLGKYHMTACTKCYKLIDPELAIENKMKCSCGGTIKKGVDFRISQIATWDKPHHPDFRPPYIHLMPLAEIISMVYDKGVTTKTVQGKWKELIDNIGNEIEILINTPIDKIANINPEIVPGIEAFRNKSLHISPGGGGKYGEISFEEKLEERKVEKSDKVTLDNF